MERVAVVTDSTADIPPEMAEELGIHIVPLSVRIADTTYEDRITISPSEFMHQLVTTHEFPTTSQPSVERFQRVYQQLATDYDAIISIHISYRLSGTYQSACWARDSLDSPAQIVVVDSRSASMGTGFPVILAARMANDGKSLNEITQAVDLAIKRSHVIFVVDTLEYLRRGGRIGRAAEIVGSILQLKPILRLEEGLVVPYARTRTRPRATAGLIDLVREIPVIDQLAIMATAGTSDAERIGRELADIVAPVHPILTELSPVLSAHIGPGGIGVAILEGAVPASIEEAAT